MTQKDNGAPAVNMAMSPEEFAELRAQAAAVGQQDVVLGRLLDSLVLHLGHAHDLDPAVEDAKAKAAAEQAAKEEADAATLKAEEDAKAAAALAPVAPAEGADNAS